MEIEHRHTLNSFTKIILFGVCVFVFTISLFVFVNKVEIGSSSSTFTKASMGVVGNNADPEQSTENTQNNDEWQSFYPIGLMLIGQENQ